MTGEEKVFGMIVAIYLIWVVAMTLKFGDI